MRHLALLGLIVSLVFPSAVGAAEAADSPSPAISSQTDAAPTASLALPPGFTYTQCPAITDSVYRLYTAYFGRNPEESGFNYWLSSYASGERGLEEISDFFASSEEFTTRYGDVNNEEFVRLIYTNVMGREADAQGLNYWLGQLDSGAINRGQAMISFSESQEYVYQTLSTTPSAGYFGWYDVGTTWQCSAGSTSIGRFGSPGFDIVLYNHSSQPQTITLGGTAGDRILETFTFDLEPWGMSIFTLGETDFDLIEMTTSQNVGWGAVWHSTWFPEDRSGWGDGEAAQRESLDLSSGSLHTTIDRTSLFG